MKVLFDTSALVAAMVEGHPRHEQAWPWLQQAKAGKVQGVVAAHSLAELYAVLTVLPLQDEDLP
jgi:predicted nucleic acid-binding protein